MLTNRVIGLPLAGLSGALAVAMSAALVTPSAEAAVSFPDYPLQSGAGSVPPNILFILDNSGSMADDYMAVPGVTRLFPDFNTRASAKNSLAYDPNVTYRPWDTDTSGTSTVVPGGTTYTAAYGHDSLATDPVNIATNGRSVFYLLRDTSAPNAITSYDRYRINDSGNVVKAAVTGSVADYDQTLAALAANTDHHVSISLPANAASVMIRMRATDSAANGRAVLLATADGTTPTLSTTRCYAAYGANQDCEFEVTGASTLRVRIRAWGGAIGSTRLLVNSTRIGSETAALPNASRNNAAEVQNIATWYSFHRTRMKVAKAGAAKAFISLGSGYRVGFDTINTDDGATNTAIRYEIPVDTNSGRFEGANRTAWFTWLHERTSRGGTPLRSSLRRAGEYYKTAAPWTDGAGSAGQACRASYALLSTDGYWNLDSGFDIGGDIDGDGWANTLADVAQKYWQEDLQPTLEDIVPTTSKDTANWQHMGLFGVSIGLQGTLPVGPKPPLAWPDPTDAEDAERIDDLWHASLNGRGAFIVASQSDEYAKALKRALDNIKEQTSSGSNITANGNSLNSGSQVFQAMFTSKLWSGDIKAYDISTGGIAPTPDWSLAAVANDPASNFASRPVMTWSASAGAVFSKASVPDASVFARGGVAPVTIDENIDYIKGVRTRESGENPLRVRVTPIGDIVNSSPFYLRELNTLFIGANDGMLHAINSETGVVRFSYVPAGIDFKALASLSDPDYMHRFFVDGPIDVSTSTQGNGKNILAAALGRGGKGVFALDVTAAHTTTFTADKVLWDQTGNNDPDMGYVLGQPLVRKSNFGGRSIVIVGNGIESVNGKAILYVYVLGADGKIQSTLKFDTLVAGNNGMSEPRAADIDGDGDVDWIYAGDLKGNLWKLDVSNANTSRWGFAHTAGNGNNAPPAPMFVARAGNGTGAVQPITGAVALAREPGSGRIFVTFGTGRLISQSDIVTRTSVEQTQTVYALIDNEQPITSYGDLQQRTIAYLGTDAAGRPARSFETYSELPPTKRGWYLNLASNAEAYGRGERVVTAPIIRGRASWFASIIPNLGAGCSNIGKGYLNVIDVFTGTNPVQGGFIDIAQPGRADDRIRLPGDSQPTGNSGYVSSIDLGVAMPGQPAQIGDQIAVAGSNARTASVRKSGSDGLPKRLNWRELINR